MPLDLYAFLPDKVTLDKRPVFSLLFVELAYCGLMAETSLPGYQSSGSDPNDSRNSFNFHSQLC